MILALLNDSVTVDVFFNSVKDASLNADNVTLLMKNNNLKNLITQDKGPFPEINIHNLETKLKEFGLENGIIQTYKSGIENNQVVVFVAGTDEEKIEKLLSVYKPQTLTRIFNI